MKTNQREVGFLHEYKKNEQNVHPRMGMYYM